MARAQVQVAEERIRLARSSLLPALSYTASATRTNFDQHEYRDRNFSTEQWSYQLTQPLYRPASYDGWTQAERLYAQAGAQLAATESELANRVVSAWFDVLAAQEMLRAVRAQKEAAKFQLATAKRSFELGAVSIADVREAEAKHAVVAAQEAQAESDLQVRQETLGQLSATQIEEQNASPWMKPALADRIGRLEDWIQLALQGNPTVVQARYQLEASGDEVSKARSGHLPNVDFTASYGYSNASGTTASAYPSRTKTAQYGVTVTVPLFSGLGTDAKIGEALALQEKARGEQAQASDQVTLSVKQAYLSLRGTLAQIPALETAQAANAVSVQANLRGYQVGMRTNADVLNAQAQLYQTEKDLAKARADAWLYFIRLRILTGQWTQEDLRAQ
jgi:outer membrane protein